MAPKLIVPIIGDDSALLASLKRSASAVNRFGKQVSGDLRSQRRAVDDLARSEGDLLRVRARRAGSVGPLRLAGLGLGAGTALFAGVQGVRALSTALQESGEEAFTATGRMKNFASSLITGDIVGATQAARAQASTLEEAGISAFEAAKKYELFKTLSGAGGPLGQLATQAVRLTDETNAAANAADALADSLARAGTNATTLGAVEFKGIRDSIFPGQVDAINQALEAQNRGGTSGRIARYLRPGAKNEAAQIVAAANEDLTELLRLQKIESARLQNVFEQSKGNLEQREAQNKQLAAARAAVITTQKAIAGDAAAKAKLAEAARQAAAREAEASRKQAAAEAKAARIEAARIAKLLEERRKTAEQARQFRLLGLSGSGDEIVPGAKNLQTRIAGALRRISSGEIDVSSKMVDRLKLARKAIRTEGGKLTEETRSTINDLIKTVTGGAEKLDKAAGPLTKTTSLRANKILEGLGLTPGVERELRARLSSFNSAGRALAGTRGPSGNFRGGIPVVESNVTVNLDGEVVARSGRKSDQRNARRNPAQKRGTRRGGV